MRFQNERDAVTVLDVVTVYIEQVLLHVQSERDFDIVIDIATIQSEMSVVTV